VSDDRPNLPGSLGDPRGRSPILGQDAALAELRDALRSGRMPAAWILHGPEGVGKLSTALRFARLLLEPDLDDAAIDAFEPPLGTESARLIDAGTHPDLRVIRKELAATSEIPRLRESKQRAIPIDLLREHMLGGEIEGRRFEALHARTPYKGVRRVFIIDEAELLNPQGQNALLKTLEEPSPRTVIMLVTTRDERMLPTVRSRCRRVPFRTLEPPAMKSWLDHGGPSIDAADRDWLLELAEGSPGRLLEAVSTGMVSWNATISPGMARLEQGAWPAGFADTLPNSSMSTRRRSSRPTSGHRRKRRTEPDSRVSRRCLRLDCARDSNALRSRATTRWLNRARGRSTRSRTRRSARIATSISSSSSPDSSGASPSPSVSASPQEPRDDRSFGDRQRG
jgi:DNA polymerase-3 subunit delta'